MTLIQNTVLSIVQAVPEIVPMLSPEAQRYVMLNTARKAADDLASINAEYNDAIAESLTRYFEGGSLASARNAFRRAAVEALGSAFDLGYADNGGELPVDGDALEWLNARIEQELGFIGTVFESAKQLKKDDEADTFQWTTDRAAGYVATVTALYNAGMMWAKSNLIGEWELGNTEKHCATCSKLNGQTHKLSWYIARNYIPRQPGASMDCGGYHCDCKIKNKKTGDIITI